MSLRKLSDSECVVSVLYAPLSWRRWNKGRIQNRLARFLLLFTLHAANAIVAAEAVHKEADRHSQCSFETIVECADGC